MESINHPDATELKGLCRIDLKEWEFRQYALKGTELQDLLRCPPNVLRLQSASKGYTRLQAAATVGHLRLGSVDLRILPKYPMTSLMMMLAEVHELTHLVPELTGYATNFDLTDLLIQFFLTHTDQVIRKGLKRSYILEEGELKTVRGQIDVRRSVGLHLRGQVGLQCRYEEHTLDNPENRILAKALQRIADCRTARLKHRNLAHQLRSHIEGISDQGSEPFHNWQFTSDRLNRHYLPAVPLAKLILKGMGIAHDFGIVDCDGFLINMNQLFESFVCRRLKALLGAKGVRTREQQTSPFDKSHQAEIKPDLIAQAPSVP